MSAKAALRTVQDVKEWFYEMKMPSWSIWNGFTKETKERAAFNDDISDLDASWDQLENHLKRKVSSGGRLTIYVCPKYGNPNGVTEYLDLPGTGVNAIQGLPVHDPYSIAGKPIDAYIAEQVNSKIDDFKKDQKIAELEAALEAKNEGSGLAKLGNKLIEELPIDQLVMAAINYFMGNKQPSAAISGISVKDDQQNNHSEEMELTDEQAATINEALGRIMMTFPDIPGFLTKLAQWIEKNPDMAKNLLSQI
jgi:hypothetical protein